MKAFPSPSHSTTGMDLRDYFAAAALQGLMLDINTMEPKQTAALAYLYADSMMEERTK
jgi:hypothetical protein